MNKSILLIDDSSFMRIILKNILEKHKYKVIGEANNGEKGFFKYKELNPDIVCLDITMDKINGIECLKLIKQYNPNAKVIICSAMGQKYFITEAMKLGAIDFIVKPFKENDIINTFDKVI